MKTCCFTGHRKIHKNIMTVTKKLHREIDKLIENGVDTFISGGALGYYQISASVIITKKNQGINIKLVLVLPCKEQDKYWSKKEKIQYQEILKGANEIIYISEEYTDNCMKIRNRKLVEMADICLCALERERTGTAQTVRFAKEKGIEVINILKEEKKDLMLDV